MVVSPWSPIVFYPTAREGYSPSTPTGYRMAGERRMKNGDPSGGRDGVEGSVGVPHAGGLVLRSGDDPLAVRAERHAIHRTGVPLEFAEFLTALGVTSTA